MERPHRQDPFPDHGRYYRETPGIGFVNPLYSFCGITPCYSQKIIDFLSILYTIVYMKTLTLSSKENIALKEIRNSIINFGRCPSLRDLMKTLGYRSPRSASLLVNKLISKGILRRNSAGSLQIVRDFEDKANIQTVDIPLLGTAPCGMPIFAEENIQAVFPVSTKLAKPPYKYFLDRKSVV